MSTMTLTEFLLARIAEDEAATRSWSRGTIDPQASEIEKRWQFARVLAECEAKRRIMERHGGRHVCEDALAGERWDDDTEDLVEWPCADLRILASVYADHPDYREEWRP